MSFSVLSPNPYDPVTTTDSTQLTDDDWGLQLPPLRYKNSKPSRVKQVCTEIKKRSRLLVVGFLTVIMLVCLIVLISLVANRGGEEHRPIGTWTRNNQGLNFYPIPDDNSLVIKFSPTHFERMKKERIVTDLDEMVSAYDHSNQVNESFVNCNETYNPGNKVCRIERKSFGHFCTEQEKYGYSKAQPCIFVQLNLPDGVTIAPIPQSSPLWQVERAALQKTSTPSSVPLVCEGATSDDKKLLEKADVFGKSVKPIEYYPDQGFRPYIYRKRNLTLPFLKPAVMVRVTSLLDKHLVTITCTAYGQLYNAKGEVINHSLLKTTFSLYVEP